MPRLWLLYATHDLLRDRALRYVDYLVSVVPTNSGTTSCDVLLPVVDHGTIFVEIRDETTSGYTRQLAVQHRTSGTASNLQVVVLLLVFKDYVNQKKPLKRHKKIIREDYLRPPDYDRISGRLFLSIVK
ncbi:hypothetical protein PCH_Pc16g02500 [Penicillium rubens Wisconsin 54-1255]|uniref:Uncharacterized protein n=1 Tax=Penicillium rubens (strain ATCC 28089 / DSM 1075 / NRRL 1951 / Wisconsin 54-1255) TaxID=500485 RepID=B6H771_PENRW|nr:hypothetical protein PCH_Pc16g02500 [Penicillium rubens Wisconsin 54-1255]